MDMDWIPEWERRMDRLKYEDVRRYHWERFHGADAVIPGDTCSWWPSSPWMPSWSRWGMPYPLDAKLAASSSE